MVFLGARFMGSFRFSCTLVLLHTLFRSPCVPATTAPLWKLCKGTNGSMCHTTATKHMQSFFHKDSATHHDPSSLLHAATAQRMRCNTGAEFSSFFWMNPVFFSGVLFIRLPYTGILNHLDVILTLHVVWRLGSFGTIFFLLLLLLFL